VEQWNGGMMGLNPIIPIIQYSIIPLFGATGRAAGGGTPSAGGAGGALKFSTAGKGKGRHHSMDFFAFTFRAGNLFGSIKY
jgi:hypothetical protein